MPQPVWCNDSAMTEPQLSIVIPAWNQLEFTVRCIESVRNNTKLSYELIVVDNGSESATAARAEQLADRFIGNDTNRGFAAAMNQGLGEAAGRYVAFVNNDTVLPAGWATSLVDTFETLPRPGIVLPAVTAAGNQVSVRSEPSDRITVFPPFTAIPSGVVYLTETSTVRSLGGWNEQYGVASAEDLDLLFTYWANGLQVALDERVLVEHESAVTVSNLPGKHAMYVANRSAFAARWAGAEPADIMRLPTCDPADFSANLEKARIAGIWMEQWFRAKDETAAAIAKAEATSGAASSEPDPDPSFVSRMLRRWTRR